MKMNMHTKLPPTVFEAVKQSMYYFQSGLFVLLRRSEQRKLNVIDKSAKLL